MITPKSLRNPKDQINVIGGELLRGRYSLQCCLDLHTGPTVYVLMVWPTFQPYRLFIPILTAPSVSAVRVWIPVLPTKCGRANPVRYYSEVSRLCIVQYTIRSLAST